jgi:hypothetical protein
VQGTYSQCQCLLLVGAPSSLVPSAARQYASLAPLRLGVTFPSSAARPASPTVSPKRQGLGGGRVWPCGGTSEAGGGARHPDAADGRRHRREGRRAACEREHEADAAAAEQPARSHAAGGRAAAVHAGAVANLSAARTRWRSRETFSSTERSFEKFTPQILPARRLFPGCDVDRAITGPPCQWPPQRLRIAAMCPRRGPMLQLEVPARGGARSSIWLGARPHTALAS